MQRIVDGRLALVTALMPRDHLSVRLCRSVSRPLQLTSSAGVYADIHAVRRFASNRNAVQRGSAEEY